MAYFNFYFLKKAIRTIVDSLFYFIKKNKKIILFLLFFIIIFFFKNNVFAIEYLEDSYPELDFTSYVNYDEETGIYSYKDLPNGRYLTNAYCILYSEKYQRFNVMFITEGMKIDNNVGLGRFIFPSPPSSINADFNYFNLEYNQDRFIFSCC